MKRKIILLVTGFLAVLIIHANETKLLRFPTIYGEKIVFSYAGDLYGTNINGGIARRLTSHDGYEIFPKFSPDGREIAFTGQYDGNTEVFKIPSEGGIPKRLTYTATLSRDDVADRMGPNNIVMAWTPDGENITYRSRKQSFNSFIGSLFNVPQEGGMSTELPLVNGGFCSYSPDGNKLAFNRVFREFRTWKHYRGGMADDIWIFDFNTKKLNNITNDLSQDIIPMWIGNEIYFLSDRDHVMNLFVYNLETNETNKVTNFKDFDIKFPSNDKKSIVFENGGKIYVFNTMTKEYKSLEIEIKNDLLNARNEIKDCSKGIRSAWLSPEGKRIAVSARGEVFSVPVNEGITYNLTKSSGAHDRSAVWSPDGKYIAYLSDRSGEYEIYIVDQKTGETKQLTKNADTYKYSLQWSPDSKKIIWSDRMLRLNYIDVETGKVTLVKRAKIIPIQDSEWSHDSKWIVFSDVSDNFFSILNLYNVESGEIHEITDSWFDSYSPVFSNDGKYLAFVSDRDFNPIYSGTEWNHAYQSMGKVYVMPLQKSTPSPFSPVNDVLDNAKEKESDSGKKTDNDSLLRVDFENIAQRVVSLPIEVADYNGLQLINNNVYYIHVNEKNVRTLKMFDLKEESEKTLLDNLTAYSVSPDNKKFILLKTSLYVVDVPVSAIKLEKPVNVDGLKVEVDYITEWEQIFNESWRQMRDFFYDENMHGVDWEKVNDKYSELLPFVAHRNDLAYLIGEMIGELNVGHAYVQSGERKKPERIATGLLGAKISRHSSGYFMIDKILDGQNWDQTLRSPLQEVAADIEEGDYIVSIDDIDLKGVEDIYSVLVGKAGKTIEIGINKKPTNANSTKHLVVPISDESGLYYYNWVKSNIDKVNNATNGEVGYVHIPDMGVNGLNQFVKYYYPQLNKKALIIDDRGNGGGNVSPMIIERLRREVIRQRSTRNSDVGLPIPMATMKGPMVLLVNEYSASDGDLFAYAFKKFGLGTVVGKRTWGGVVGISGSLPFVDGGELNRPEYASFSAENSEWIIEGHGVDPDVDVDNNPYLEYLGEDNQLDKAIQLILEDLKDYRELPPIPKSPVKSK